MSKFFAGVVKEILGTAHSVSRTVDGQDPHIINGINKVHHHFHHGAAPNAETSTSQTSSDILKPLGTSNAFAKLSGKVELHCNVAP